MIIDKKVSDFRWLFSIITKFLAAYILRIPVIKLDVPGKKLLNEKIKLVEQMGSEK